MTTTNAPAQVPQTQNEETTAERKDRLYVGDREHKFVIKLLSPVPT